MVSPATEGKSEFSPRRPVLLQETDMRRRTFLTATAAAGAAVAALPALTACVPRKRHEAEPPTPIPPPSPDAIPSAFADKPTWPGTYLITSLNAARDRYLCGAAALSEASETCTGGWCPIIVDISGPTTRAVLPDPASPDDPDGAWTTKEVELKDPDDQDDNVPKTARITITDGPALLDAEHAYLTLGTSTPSAPSPTSPPQSAGTTDDETYSNTLLDERTCSVLMLKVRLSDGAVVASTTLSEQFYAQLVPSMHLSFSADRTSLILAGDNMTLQGHADADYIGLRLSADDLSTQFDAHSVLGNQYGTAITSYGQAISIGDETVPTREIVFLADGVHEPIGDNIPIMVRDGWYYYMDSAEAAAPCYARNLENRASGQTVELDAGWEKDVALKHWPDITSDQQEIITLGQNDGDEDTAAVRLPGAPSPAIAFAWASDGRVDPEGMGVFGGVLYVSYPGHSATPGNDRLELIAVSTGETITRTYKAAVRSGPSEIDVVTPWGLATDSEFFPATEWLDSASASTPPEPSAPAAPSSPSTPTSAPETTAPTPSPAAS